MTQNKSNMAVLFADVSDSTNLYEAIGDTAAFSNVRETISPDGLMPPEGPANSLKFLAEGDPKIVPSQIKLAETWTNEFAQRAKKQS